MLLASWAMPRTCNVNCCTGDERPSASVRVVMDGHGQPDKHGWTSATGQHKQRSMTPGMTPGDGLMVAMTQPSIALARQSAAYCST